MLQSRVKRGGRAGREKKWLDVRRGKEGGWDGMEISAAFSDNRYLPGWARELCFLEKRLNVAFFARLSADTKKRETSSYLTDFLSLSFFAP